MAHDLKSMLEFEEGRKHDAYPDPLTGGEPWTIGVGHTGSEVHPGLTWTDEEIDAAYDADVFKASALCQRNLPWFNALDDARRCVLLGMAFQMGTRLLTFHKTLDAMRDEHWETAAAEMTDSDWARETPARARRMARQVSTGQWQ